MPSLGNFLLLASFVVCAYAVAASVAGARRRSRRLIESGIGAFYLITALMTVASGGDGPRLRHQRLLDQVRRSATRTRCSRWPTRSRRTGAGSTARSCSGCSCSAIFGTIAVYTNRERHRELIPVRRRGDRDGRDVLPLPDGGAQQPVLDVSSAQAPADGKGLNPLLQNFYMAIHPPSLYIGFVVDDDPVRLRHGGADHRAPRRLVAARGAALDDGRLAVAVVRPDARDAVGVRGARMGRVLGLGSGRERRGCCRGSRRRRFSTRSWCRSAAACCASGTSRSSSSRSS